MIRVNVGVSPRPYDVLIEGGLLNRAGSHLHEILERPATLFVVTTPVVRKRWGKALMVSLTGAGFVARFVEMPDGEAHKKLATVESLAEKLVNLGAGRDSVFLAFGGGVVGDVTGMLSSI